MCISSKPIMESFCPGALDGNDLLFWAAFFWSLVKDKIKKITTDGAKTAANRQMWRTRHKVSWLPVLVFQFRYKRRVYTQTHLDEKQLSKLHTKVRANTDHAHVLLRNVYVASEGLWIQKMIFPILIRELTREYLTSPAKLPNFQPLLRCWNRCL